MAILHPNKNEFVELLKGNKLLVVDFFVTWCGPCKVFSPILEEVAETVDENVKIAKVDIDENDELAEENNIQAVPTIVFFKNGQELERRTGVINKDELLEIIEKNK